MTNNVFTGTHIPSKTSFRPLFCLRVPLILASASPRRQDFLREWGIPFLVDAPENTEPAPAPGEAPRAYVLRAARCKGKAVASRYSESLILAADTIVTRKQNILGKPHDDAHALAMLQDLNGQTHTVMTGVWLLLPNGEEQSFCSETEVTFHHWPTHILQAYVRTGEPADKAGSYAIQGQGAFLVKSISGSWSTVVGLPVTELASILLEKGIMQNASE